MDTLLLPSKVEWHDGQQPNQKQVVIEPCFYGYGTTLGNALRRVLLSSLPGAAVTAVKITGVEHEFSTVDGVTEDVVEILLNLKRLRVRSHSAEPVTVKLTSKGVTEVTAADFEKNADVEIINPELVIATLNDKKATFEMEVTIEQGLGYVPTEQQDKSQLTVGQIAVDALYSPVVNVGYAVENTRVGDVTNYDKLTITIETDGIITPEEAFERSVAILIEQFAALQAGGHTPAESTEAAAGAEETVSEEVGSASAEATADEEAAE